MLREHPELTERAAVWFSEKWEIPVEEYRKSILEGINHPENIPQWYLMVEVVEGEPDEEGKILAGAGLIENDFHPRKDLKPNLCALYVEEEYRLQGIARAMLDFIEVMQWSLDTILCILLQSMKISMKSADGIFTDLFAMMTDA